MGTCRLGTCRHEQPPPGGAAAGWRASTDSLQGFRLRQQGERYSFRANELSYGVIGRLNSLRAVAVLHFATCSRLSPRSSATLAATAAT